MVKFINDMKIKFAKHAAAILENEIVPLGSFCSRPKSAGTLAKNFEKWSKKVKKDRLSTQESGIYCFWWIGEEEILDQGLKTHLLKGKEIGRDEARFHPELQTARDRHILHRITWKFERNRATGFYPLYVGKASTIQNRFSQHIQWPKRSFPNYEPLGEVAEIQKAQKGYNSYTQFRKPFEYLFQEQSFEERIKYLLNNVGISFINTKFHDVPNRFFWEDELVGLLRPSFNLDSER